MKLSENCNFFHLRQSLSVLSQFHSWFLKYKSSDIKECVLSSVRVKAGLDPTHKFTTNVSESINRDQTGSELEGEQTPCIDRSPQSNNGAA